MSAEKPNAERLLRERIAKAIHRENDLCVREESWESGYECMCFPMAEAAIAALQSIPSAVGQPSLEKLRERIEALPRYRWTKKGVTEHPDGNWLNGEAVLDAFEKEGK